MESKLKQSQADNLGKRNKLIYEKYAEMWGQGLREDLIITRLSEQYFIAESTLYRIILKQSKTVKSE